MLKLFPPCVWKEIERGLTPFPPSRIARQSEGWNQ
jgi:hypothetical protein